jgi:hypothetical protein
LVERLDRIGYKWRNALVVQRGRKCKYSCAGVEVRGYPFLSTQFRRIQMRAKAFVVLGVCAVLACSSSSFAAQATYFLSMDGAQEVPGPGDPDGSGMGSITLDDVSGEISWDFTYENISAPTAMHIHGPDAPAGTAAGVYIGLGVATTGGAGTLTNSLVHGNLAQITAILSEPENFYVNIHTGDFTPGAVRANLPEPASLALLAIGGLAIARRSRKN